MKAKFGWAGLLAALAVAGMPDVSSAGWSSALTTGLRPPGAPHAVTAEVEATKAGKASGQKVFRLACHSCRSGSGYYAGYGSYYPSYSYYAGYSGFYPSYSYYGGYSSFYPSYSYYPSVSYYSGCGTCSPGCGSSYSYYYGW